MLKFAVLIISLSAVLAKVPPKLPTAGNRNFFEFVIQARDIIDLNKSTSMECFNYYIPIMNEITAEYEKAYTGCVERATMARDQIDASTQPDRKKIEDSSKKSCDELNACKKFTDSVDYFDCYSKVGAANSNVMNTISFDASEVLLHVTEQYRIIEDQETRCTTAAERAYVEDTATSYNEMQDCINGKTSVPSTTTAGPPTQPEPEPEPEVPEGFHIFSSKNLKKFEY